MTVFREMRKILEWCICYRRGVIIITKFKGDREGVTVGGVTVLREV